MTQQDSVVDSTVSPALPGTLLAVAIDTFDACVAIMRGPELRLDFVNRSFQALCPDEPMLGRRFCEVFPRQEGGDLPRRLLQVLASGERWRVERYEAVTQAGEVRFWDGEVVSAGEPGMQGSLVLFGRVVTPTVHMERALKASEEALREANQKLRDTIDSITDGVIVLDRDWRYTMASERAGHLVGMPPEQLLGGCVWDLFPDAIGTQFHQRFHEAMDTGQAVHFEEYYPAPLDRWLECNAYPSPAGLSVYFRDVSERRRAEQALRESTALLSAISDGSPDVIYAKDAAGRMRFANPAALALIGKPIEEVLGRTDAELLGDPEAARQVMENDRRVMATGASEELEEVVPLPDGRRKLWLSMKTALRDKDGNVVGLLGISHDITDRKRSEQQLREESHRKDEFLAMLAHELRNPLAPIVTGARLLDMSAHDEGRVRGAARVIARQAAHMTALVDDLLDVSRVTRGLIKLELAEVDLCQVSAHAIEQARPLIEARHHHFEAALPAEPVRIRGDRTRLIQTVSNLLNNAAKYTPPGGRVVLALAVRGQEVDIRIGDSGIGIPPALLPKVFDLFVQGERTPDRAQGGLGLGLALVKSIATMHGGRIAAYSDGAGQGSSFVLTLPRLAAAGLACAGPDAQGRVEAGQAGAEAESTTVSTVKSVANADAESTSESNVDAESRTEFSVDAESTAGPQVVAVAAANANAESTAASPAKATAGAEPPRYPRRRVMVVDDNVDAGVTLAQLLEVHGHRVSVHADAHDALQAIETAAAADVFILDIGLPDMNGYDLARRLRAHPSAHRSTLIALTGYGQTADREAGKAAGFDHYFVKPADADELAQLLAR